MLYALGGLRVCLETLEGCKRGTQFGVFLVYVASSWCAITDQR
jgi:hypothetical protein